MPELRFYSVSRQQPKDEVETKPCWRPEGPSSSTASRLLCQVTGPHTDFLPAQVGIHSKIRPPSAPQASSYFLLRFPKQDVARPFSNPQQITSPSTCPSQLSLNPCRLLTANRCCKDCHGSTTCSKKITGFFLLNSWLILLHVI